MNAFCHCSLESIWEEFQIIGWITITKVNKSNFSQLEHFQPPLQSQVVGNEKGEHQMLEIYQGDFFMRLVKF